jgi:hypothetical protein
VVLAEAVAELLEPRRDLVHLAGLRIEHAAATSRSRQAKGGR